MWLESLNDKGNIFAESHVGVFMQNFVRRQWRCMFFFECKCTLLRFFLMACALRKGNCIFKSLKNLMSEKYKKSYLFSPL